jgi:pyruvate ferredoxin oxidoreductase alpha subunit
MENAKYALVTMGSLAGTAKHVLRHRKIRDVGLIRVKSFRPFPADEIKKAIKDVDSVGVLEKDISPGLGGVLCSEIRGLTRKKNVSMFVGGLGGRDVKADDFMKIFQDIRQERRGLIWV